MSRCKACDVILNDYELSKTEPETGEFVDLCNRCLTSGISASYNYHMGDVDCDLEPEDMEGDSVWLT